MWSLKRRADHSPTPGVSREGDDDNGICTQRQKERNQEPAVQASLAPRQDADFSEVFSSSRSSSPSWQSLGNTQGTGTVTETQVTGTKFRRTGGGGWKAPGETWGIGSGGRETGMDSDQLNGCNCSNFLSPSKRHKN